MLKKLLVLTLASGALLTACTGSSSTSNGGNTPIVQSQSGVLIDPMGIVPVLNGTGTQGTIYIHNYNNTSVEGISFHLNQPTLTSQVKHMLAYAGLKIGGIEDQNGFVLLNSERCVKIAANSSCAINFVTPNLSFANQGNSLVSLSYTLNGKTITNSQVVNYSYVDSSTLSGINFTGNVDLSVTSGTTKYVVGYLYGASSSNGVYKNVNLVPSNSSARISGGFTNNQEVGSNQVVAVEFAVSQQDTKSNAVNIVPTWSNGSVMAQGSSFGIALLPTLNTANYVFGSVPLLTAPTTESTVINVVNNGNADGSVGMTVVKEGGQESALTINYTNCANTVLQANAANSCQIRFSVLGYDSGSTVVIYKNSNGVELARQQVIWLNNSSVPAVKVIPNPKNITLIKHENSSLISFTFQNVGGAPLESINYNLVTNGPGVLVNESSNCPVTLAPRQSCVITGNIYGADDGVGGLVYRASGSYNLVNYNYGSAALTYEIQARPDLHITPASVVNVTVLANNESSVTQEYTVTNHGSDPALFTGVYLESMTNLHKPKIDAANSSCTSNMTLNESNSCTVVILYGPESSNIAINESGSTHLIVDYHGGTPDTDYTVISESYIYSLVGNDTYASESVAVSGFDAGEGTALNPYLANALNESGQIKVTYTNPSLNYPLTNFSLNTNDLPYGMKIISTDCPVNSVGTIEMGASCDVVFALDKELLKTSPQGGTTVFDFKTPTATWTTPLGFYEQPGTNIFLSYMEPTVSFTLNNNNGYFESTVLTASLVNSDAGANSINIDVSSVELFLESQPVGLTNNCSVSSGSAQCTLSAGVNTGKVAYIMPTYMRSESTANIPLVFETNEIVYLNPNYIFINFIQD